MKISTELELTCTPKIKWLKPDKKVWTAMRNRLSKGRNLSAEVGWFRGNYHVGKNGLTLPTAQIAKWNEEGHFTGGLYGINYSPPRPFIRVGFTIAIEDDKSTQALFVKFTQDVAEGRKTWKQVYLELGARLLIRLQKAINMDIYRANTPLTIALKGHGITLIDTGQMRDSIEYRVGKR